MPTEREQLTQVVPGRSPMGFVKFITGIDHEQIRLDYPVTATRPHDTNEATLGEEGCSGLVPPSTG